MYEFDAEIAKEDALWNIELALAFNALSWFVVPAAPATKLEAVWINSPICVVAAVIVVDWLLFVIAESDALVSNLVTLVAIPVPPPPTDASKSVTLSSIEADEE